MSSAFARSARLNKVANTTELHTIYEYPRQYFQLFWTLNKALNDPEDPKYLAQFFAQPISWGELVVWLEHHRLTPLFYYVLRNSEQRLQVPSNAWEQIRDSYYSSVLRQDKLTLQLEQVLNAFQAEEISIILLKGAPLARSIYPEPALRPMNDLDILVLPSQLTTIFSVLKDLGYWRLPHSNGHPPNFQELFDVEVDFVDLTLNHPAQLDVHWRFSNRWLYTRSLRISAFWESALRLDWNGFTAFQFSSEDMLIHLCTHIAANHAFVCPALFYVDIDRVIRYSKPPLDWNLLVERSNQFRVKPHLYFTLQGAQEYLDSPIPSWVSEELEPSPFRVGLVRRIIGTDEQQILRNQPRTELVAYFIRMLLAQRLLDGFYTLYKFFFPGKKWLVTRYGLTTPWKIILYSILHPFRWLIVGFSALWAIIIHAKR